MYCVLSYKRFIYAYVNENIIIALYSLYRQRSHFLFISVYVWCKERHNRLRYAFLFWTLTPLLNKTLFVNGYFIIARINQVPKKDCITYLIASSISVLVGSTWKCGGKMNYRYSVLSLLATSWKTWTESILRCIYVVQGLPAFPMAVHRSLIRQVVLQEIKKIRIILHAVQFKIYCVLEINMFTWYVVSNRYGLMHTVCNYKKFKKKVEKYVPI